MSRSRLVRSLVIAALPVAVLTIAGVANPWRAQAQQSAPKSAQRSQIAFDRALPPMDGQHLTMKVVDVRLAPGETSPPHRHNCAVVVYVISGTVRMQVRGGPEAVYKPGETFYERPTDIHQVSANASATDSARFSATFVCDHEGPLSMPASPGASGH